MLNLPRFDGTPACAEIGGDEWFPESGGEGAAITRQAIAVCNVCEIQDACLEWALQNPEEEGIWGGLTESQRAGLQQDVRRFRPIAHGSEAGYKAHYRRGETACSDCQVANSAARRAREDRAVVA